MKQLAKSLILILLMAFGGLLSAQPMTVISLNIRYNSYNNIDGENGWPNRKAAVARMILEERPVAIGLQEALIDQLQYLDSALPGYHRVGVGRDDGKEAGEFMAIYYDTARLELVSGTTRWLSATPEEPSLGWDAACRRTVTITRFRDRQTDKEFYYLNTHLDHVGKTARAEAAKYIATLVAELPFEAPVIVGGDMNSTIDDPIFQNFYAVHLQAARTLTRHTSHLDTYNAYGKDKSSLIDHFFVRNIKVNSFRTLNGDYGVPYISDHYPIGMTIKL